MLLCTGVVSRSWAISSAEVAWGRKGWAHDDAFGICFDGVWCRSENEITYLHVHVPITTGTNL
jgi:hypothetical protein